MSLELDNFTHWFVESFLMYEVLKRAGGRIFYLIANKLTVIKKVQRSRSIACTAQALIFLPFVFAVKMVDEIDLLSSTCFSVLVVFFA